MVLLGGTVRRRVLSGCPRISQCHSRASDNGPELVNRAGSDGSSLGAARDTTALLLAGLFYSSQNCVPSSFQNELSAERQRTWSKWHRTRLCQSLRKSGGNGSVSLSSSGRSGCLSSSGGILLTVVGDLLIVLDRLDAEFSSAHAQKWGDGGIVSAGAAAAAALTIVTVVDQAPLDCRLEITGRREGGCNLEVSAWKGDWPKFLEGLDNPMSVVGNFDSPADCAGGAPHNSSSSSCGLPGDCRLTERSSSCSPKHASPSNMTAMSMIGVSFIDQACPPCTALQMVNAMD